MSKNLAEQETHNCWTCFTMTLSEKVLRRVPQRALQKGEGWGEGGLRALHQLPLLEYISCTRYGYIKMGSSVSHHKLDGAVGKLVILKFCVLNFGILLTPFLLQF